jgi:3',5'-cyclic AMP phosphodiesterase CpdA
MRLGVVRLPLIVVSLASALAGCFEYSPHALPDDASERDLNTKAIERLAAQPAERLRFAVVGDTQRAFEDAEDAVDAINARDDVQFVVQVGDFTNVGLLFEYREMHEIFARLRVPYLVVVGIHDHYGNGGAIYRSMYGPTDLVFTLGRVRFVFFDSNSEAPGLDRKVPDLAWLEEALAPSPDHDHLLTFSHIQPGGGLFDPELTEPLFALLGRAGVDISFHAHAHRWDEFERDGVRYVVADAVDHRSYVVVSQRADGGFDYERVFF